NIDVDVAICPLLNIYFQFVDLGAFAADDDSGPGREDGDAKLVRHPLDLNTGNAGMLQLLLEIALDKPSRMPGLGHSQPKSVWMCLLTHYSLSPSSMVMWLVRR